MNPKILLVEDDPVTRAYLSALLADVPAAVDQASCMAEGLRLADAGRHDLLLIDANLPDGSGADLLAALRARGLRMPALAHTAAREPGELAPLIEAGFAEVLLKPVDADAWLAAIRRTLGLRQADSNVASVPLQRGAAPVWDDAAAARALGGSAANVAALRGLFLAELPGQLAAVRGGGDTARHDTLHRLRASCGLVGATRLDHAVRTLQETPASSEAVHAFLEAAQDTLAGMRD